MLSGSTVLGLGSYKTAWVWLHKLRRAMVRDQLSGVVRLCRGRGGWSAGPREIKKAIVAIAARSKDARSG